MGLNQEQRERLIADTRDAAGAFVEDMDYFREAVARKDTSRREIRHLSATLRRLIVERDISIIAAPRLGKITATSPDNRPYYRAAEQIPFMLFLSGGASVFDGRVDRISAFDVRVSPGLPHTAIIEDVTRRLPGDDAVTSTQLNLDQFSQQKVICYRGRWITRQRVIKYMANISSGVHSGAPDDEDDQALARLRSSSSVSLKNGGLHLDLFRHGVDTDELTINHTPDSVDLVLVETLAAATWLTVSPVLRELEATIRAELGLPAASPP